MSFLFSQLAPGVLPANSVDFSEVETIASNTLLGNNTGSDSVILELSKTQATAMLDVMGAASAGSGGLKGLVPASSAGDQTKFLRADATWATVDLSNLADRNLSNLSAPTALNQVLLGQDGTAAAPAYSFISDTNTGIYRSAADTMVFTTNGAARMTISSNNITTNTRLIVGDALSINGGLFEDSVTCGQPLIFTLTNYGSGLAWVCDITQFYHYTYSIGKGSQNQGNASNLRRPYSIDSAGYIHVGKKINNKQMYGGTLSARIPDELTLPHTSNANNSTTITVTPPPGYGNGSVYFYIHVGDVVRLNGLSTIARVITAFDGTSFTVDTALGDGVARAILLTQYAASFRINDGTEIFSVNPDVLTTISAGEKHKSLHAQAGTLDIITATTSDYYIGVDTSSAAKTVNLPAAATAGQGFVLVIKDESGNAATRNITIDANASELIDGALTQVVNTNYGSVSLMCSGSAWFIM